jgi:hypothetical protein
MDEQKVANNGGSYLLSPLPGSSLPELLSSLPHRVRHCWKKGHHNGNDGRKNQFKGKCQSLGLSFIGDDIGGNVHYLQRQKSAAENQQRHRRHRCFVLIFLLFVTSKRVAERFP